MKDPATLAKDTARDITVLFGGNGLTTQQATDRTAAIIEKLLSEYATEHADLIVQGMRDSGY